MPYSPAQHRLFEAAARDPAIARAHGIPVNIAAQMASEGIKPPAKAATKAQILARALHSMKGQP